MQVEYVPKKEELYRIASSNRATRCGATEEPDRRKYGYSRSSVGMTGTMYCLKVDNMYQEENNLLSFKNWTGNVQKRSNVAGTPGNVYVIVEN